MTLVSTPIKQNNAIEVATFALHLSRLADAEGLTRIHDAFDQLSPELALPGKEQRQNFIVQFGSGNAPIPSPSPHTDMARFVASPSGAHLWRVTLEGPILTVMCHDYTCYETVWSRAARYLQEALTALGNSYSVVEISHQVLDRFNYQTGAGQDPHEAYQIDELFREDSPYLTPHTRNCGLLWHVFQGWFITDAEGRRDLHQLNVSSTQTGENAFAALIDHRATAPAIAGPEPVSAVEAMPALAQDFSRLHACNVQVMRGLLTDAKLLEIGMETPA